MSPSQVVSQASSKFTAGVERFQDSLKALRTGRASASILDGVTVEAYGQPMPLIQLAELLRQKPSYCKLLLLTSTILKLFQKP